MGHEMAIGVTRVRNDYSIKWRVVVNGFHLFPIFLAIAQYPLLSSPGLLLGFILSYTSDPMILTP